MSIINHSAVVRLTADSALPKTCEGMAVYKTSSNTAALAAAATPAIGVVTHVRTCRDVVTEVDVALIGSGIVADVQVAAGTYAAGSYLEDAASGGLFVAVDDDDLGDLVAGQFVRVVDNVTLTGTGLVAVVL